MSLFVGFLLLQFLSSTSPRSSAVLALQQIAWLAFQSTAQFVQDVSAIHSRAVVVQPEQCGVANTRFLSQAIHGPSFLLEYLSEATKNHGGTLAVPKRVCQYIITCIIYFTQLNTDSRLKLASALNGKADIDAEVNRSEVERHAT